MRKEYNYTTPVKLMNPSISGSIIGGVIGAGIMGLLMVSHGTKPSDLFRNASMNLAPLGMIVGIVAGAVIGFLVSGDN